MECNKDEAARAKSIAESKLENKDFTGAKKFALKAQSLYPALEGIAQMLTTLEVYISAEKKVNGQVNWYAVLGVGPTAEDEAIKKQYRKLALLLHPDKNKSVGADGAFKLISEAWGLLSDKSKRSYYNQITDIKIPTSTSRPSSSTVHPTSASRPSPSNVHPTSSSRPSPSNVHPFGPPNYTGSSCAQPAGPSGTKSSKKKPAAPKPPKKKTTKAGPAPPKQTPVTLKAESFWTICNLCKSQYEYHNMYLNTTLLCHNCQRPFVASAIARPAAKSKLPKSSPGVKQSSSANNNVSNSKPASSVNNVKGKNVVPAAQKPGVVKAASKTPVRTQQTFPKASINVSSAAGPSVVDKLKRPVPTESSARMDGLKKKAKFDSHNGKNYNSNYKTQERRSDHSEATGNKLDAKAPREPTFLETRKLLMGTAQKEISRKLDEQRVEIVNKNTSKNNNNKRRDNKPEKRQTGPADTIEKDKKPEKINGNIHKKANVDLPLPAEKAPESNNAVVMNVQDPDFFDFDQDRSENSFVDNEVWSAYDDEDGMPRLYALIHKVISKKPFQLKISWLNSKTTTEFSPTLDWVGSGFYKTCGEFRVGKHESCWFVNAFSQRVKWSKGPRGTILIFPQKGEVWALYRNWSRDWDTQTSDEVIRSYDMVLVLDGYDEKSGLVSICPLVKVAGYKTVFCPDTRNEAVVEIKREEMFRFSHRVPHHNLTSQEAPAAPDGCVELDPAATPLELLEVGAGSDVGTMKGEVKEKDGQSFVANEVHSG